MRPEQPQGDRPRPTPLAIVVMGVSGSGKSTIGHALAERRGAPFVEGDDLHPAANVERMARSEPLDDDARWPWLDEVARAIARHQRDGLDVVVACSALRQPYRDRLRLAGQVVFVWLSASRAALAQRVSERTHEFMPPELLADQLATFEEPGEGETDVLIVMPHAEISRTVDAVEAALADAGHGRLTT